MQREASLQILMGTLEEAVVLGPGKDHAKHQNVFEP